MKLLLAISILFFSFTANCQQVTSIQFESTNINLDSICAGTNSYELKWRFVNTGKVPVFIKRVQTSGSILVCSWNKEPVLPGKTAFIKGSICTHGWENQHFTKYADVTLEDGNTIKLSVKGFIKDCSQTAPIPIKHQ